MVSCGLHAAVTECLHVCKEGFLAVQIPVVQIEAFLPANLMPEPLYRRGRLTRRLLAVKVPGKQRQGALLDGVDLYTMGSKHKSIILHDLELRGRITVGAM